MIKPYFSHDINARSDEKIKRLLMRHGMLGYGVYWAIIEDLYQNANALRTEYDRIAYELRVEKNAIESIINDFDLFEISGDTFSSASVQRRIDMQEIKSKKARESANIRWKNEHSRASECDGNANAMRGECDSNAINKSKVNELKKIKKENYQDLPQSSPNICSPEVDSKFLDMSLKFHKKQKLNGYYHVDFKNGITEKSRVVISGADTLRKICEIDGEKIEDISKVLDFILKDDFWRDQVISLSGLRGRKSKDGNYKYFTIKNKMLREGKNESSSLFREVMEKVEKMEEEK